MKIFGKSVQLSIQPISNLLTFEPQKPGIEVFRQTDVSWNGEKRVTTEYHGMEEKLLTNNEIELILKESVDPKYHIDDLLHLGGKFTSIKRISKKTGLILIKGNDSTCFDHILVRHHPMSKAGYWIHGEKIKLNNPSKFSLDTIPIFDFLKIADEIFKPENKVTDQRNKRPDTFDLYIGKFTNNKNLSMDYKLLLYQGTLIIHNLYPSKKTFNKKRIIDLRQGFTSSSRNLMQGIHEYKMPYYDHLNVERAIVIIRLQTHNGKEDWYIQINDKKGIPIFTYLTASKIVDSYIDMPIRLTSLDYHEDCSTIEKIMKKLIEQYQ